VSKRSGRSNQWPGRRRRDPPPSQLVPADNSRCNSCRHCLIRANTRHRGMRRSQLSSYGPRTRRLRSRPVRGAGRCDSGGRSFLLHGSAAMGNPGTGVRVGTASHRRGGPYRHLQKLAARPAVSNTRDMRGKPGPPLVSRSSALVTVRPPRASLASAAPRKLSDSASSSPRRTGRRPCAAGPRPHCGGRRGRFPSNQ
jgi:hypothetical protein